MIGVGFKFLLGRTLGEPLTVIGLISMAMWIDHNLTLIFLCGAPMALYAISKLGRKIKRATKRRSNIRSNLYQFIEPEKHSTHCERQLHVITGDTRTSLLTLGLGEKYRIWNYYSRGMDEMC